MKIAVKRIAMLSLIINLIISGVFFFSPKAFAAGTSPSSADSISFNKNYSGTFVFNEPDTSQSVYYKFKTDSNKNTQYTLRGECTKKGKGMFRFEIYLLDDDYDEITDNGEKYKDRKTGDRFFRLWNQGDADSITFKNLRANSTYYVCVYHAYSFNLSDNEPCSYSISVNKKLIKKANPLKIKSKTVSVNYSKLKRNNQTLAVGKVITFTRKGQGTLSYKKVSGNKKIVISAKTGKVTVKKGLKKGTYKVKVKVKASGNTNYKASTWKITTFKIRVR